jgi:phosphoglycolate phosphatase
MIGDTTHDLAHGANNAGASGVAVEYGAHPVQQLQACSIRCIHARNVPSKCCTNG